MLASTECRSIGSWQRNKGVEERDEGERRNRSCRAYECGSDYPGGALIIEEGFGLFAFLVGKLVQPGCVSAISSSSSQPTIWQAHA